MKFERTTDGGVMVTAPSGESFQMQQGDWCTAVAGVSRMPVNLARPTIMAIHNMDVPKGYCVSITIKKSEV